jgi:hypothetical protein
MELHECAELVLRSELVAGARPVLDGPPKFAVKQLAEQRCVFDTKQTLHRRPCPRCRA